MPIKTSARKLFAFFVLALLAIISGYTIFHVSSVVSNNNLNRSIVLATRLIDVTWLPFNTSKLEEGYFTSIFTFENRAGQTLTLTSLEAHYYRKGDVGMYTAANGGIEQPTELSPGKTQIAIQMNTTSDFSSVLQPSNSFTPSSYLAADYTLQFGTIHYKFESKTYWGEIMIWDPYRIGEDQASIEVATSTFLTVDSWVFGLEVIAVFTLVHTRKADKPVNGQAQSNHSKMAAAVYASQGIGLVVFWPLGILWLNSRIPEASSGTYVPHGGAPVGEFFGAVFFGGYYLFSLILLGISYGLFSHQPRAISAAYELSIFGAPITFALGALLLINSATALISAIGTLILGVAFSDVLVVYTLRHPKLHP
jgi:hypothetical protein